MARILVTITVNFVPDPTLGVAVMTMQYHEAVESYAEFDDLLEMLDNSGYFDEFKTENNQATLTVHSPVDDDVDKFVCQALDVVCKRH